jgi:hypothetical protein
MRFVSTALVMMTLALTLLALTLLIIVAGSVRPSKAHVLEDSIECLSDVCTFLRPESRNILFQQPPNSHAPTLNNAPRRYIT